VQLQLTKVSLVIAKATKDAIKVCKEDKRKRVTAADIRAATR